MKSATATTAGLGVIGMSGLASASGYSVISTRGHYDGDGNLKSGYSVYDYETDGSVPGQDMGCVSELTVHVHGFNNTAQDALNNFQEANDDLRAAGYGGALAGFTWDSDAPSLWNPTDWGGFGTAQDIAQQNGYALAQFALNYKTWCPNGVLRLTCHSLGAQVIFNALRILNRDSYWKDGGYLFDSVHLLGAAQDNEAPTKEWMDTYNAINDTTVATFDYHSEDDSVLKYLYLPRELDFALGQTGYEDGNTPAPNYVENDVTSKVGSDHSSYMNECANEIVYHMANDSSFA